MFIELWPLSAMSPSGATCRSCPASTPKHLVNGDDPFLSPSQGEED